MLESTFQLVRGVGPAGERRLWRAGVARWRDLDAAAAAAVGRRAAPLAGAVEGATRALGRGDVGRLARLLPAGESWRLLGAFGDDAVYLDIETGDEVWGREGVSAIGFLDRDGPRLLLAGRDLERFPALARRWKLLVTFNGSSFDVPILRRAFPGWTPPAAHVDLRHALARLGHEGGLKAIEDELDGALALARPAHLRGIDGWAACGLFRRGRGGDRTALRLFCEYNLYDVVNLRTLAAYAYNALAAEEVAAAPALRAHVSALPVPRRGDVLYDVSKILLSL
ncbi:MAG TPA: ribonuclease H-like domain-containing protein [Polyangia bacterium]|nr:ribonuclease H-like domain-containing protein [Polyangia bacterium]